MRTYNRGEEAQANKNLPRSKPIDNVSGLTIDDTLQPVTNVSRPFIPDDIFVEVFRLVMLLSDATTKIVT